jgi:hypothetical protein
LRAVQVAMAPQLWRHAYKAYREFMDRLQESIRRPLRLGEAAIDQHADFGALRKLFSAFRGGAEGGVKFESGREN